MWRKEETCLGSGTSPLSLCAGASGSRKQISDIIKLIKIKGENNVKKLDTGYDMTVPLYNLIEEMCLGLPRQSIIHELNDQASITCLDALIH